MFVDIMNCLSEHLSNVCVVLCVVVYKITNEKRHTQTQSIMYYLSVNRRKQYGDVLMFRHLMEVRLLPFWVVWKIWNARNVFLFQQMNSMPQDVASGSLNAVSEWNIGKRKHGSWKFVM